MSAYDEIPERLLTRLHEHGSGPHKDGLYCAGYEVEVWRCNALAAHLMDWIADYALIEEELDVKHTNMYVRLRQAAIRIYTSDNYQKRGEVGELVLHAICRDFFDTIPIAPRVFYLTASNDVVKSFDMVHVRYTSGNFELWLGEAKFYEDSAAAIKSAIASIQKHIDAGFLTNEKLLLGPQVSKSIPHYEEIRTLLSQNTSLDKLFQTAVFPVCIAADSAAVGLHKSHTAEYLAAATGELLALRASLDTSGLPTKIKIVLLYVPLQTKAAVAEAFDKRLKGLQ